jgi:hypothetical protein
MEPNLAESISGSDHKIVKYSVILGGDRSSTIIQENKDIYVVKGGNLHNILFFIDRN